MRRLLAVEGPRQGLRATAADVQRVPRLLDDQRNSEKGGHEFVKDVPLLPVGQAANLKTPEAISIRGSKGFCLAVQWHPEWNASKDEISSKLFLAFKAALNGERSFSGKEQLVG